MQYLDGVTSAPRSFSAQAGGELQSCEQQQIATLDPLKYNFLPTIVLSALINNIYKILLLQFHLVIAY